MEQIEIERRAAAPALDVFELPDLLAVILRLAAAPDALLLNKRVARAARAVAPVVRKLIWQDRILKGTAILNGHAGTVVSCALSPDGTRVVTASLHKKALLWDAETGSLLLTLEGHSAGSVVKLCVFSPDGTRVATASGETVELWDAEAGALQKELEGHIGNVSLAARSRQTASTS